MVFSLWLGVTGENIIAGTGAGRMQPMIAARQMQQAYKEIIWEESIGFITFGDAQKYHWNINLQGMIRRH